MEAPAIVATRPQHRDISVNGENARQKCYLQFFTKKDSAIDGYICVYDDWLKRENGAWKYSRRDVISKDRFSHLEV